MSEAELVYRELMRLDGHAIVIRHATLEWWAHCINANNGERSLDQKGATLSEALGKVQPYRGWQP